MVDIFNKILTVLISVRLYKILQVFSGPPQSDIPHKSSVQLVCNFMEDQVFHKYI